MYRIRFHGRGGQGMKTGSRILGTALFNDGFEVQDAPRYGAERRGAPIFAYVRASKKTICERGVIDHPDLIIVADDSLIPIPAAGITPGINSKTVILINSNETADVWQKRLNILCRVVAIPVIEDVTDRTIIPYIGAACAGAAAKLVGVVSLESLELAIKEDLSKLGPKVVDANIEKATDAFKMISDHTDVVVSEGDAVPADKYKKPDWINLAFETAKTSAPVIHAGLTSVEVKTGLWRSMRPVIDKDQCNHCWWLCSTFCPDGAINVNNNVPEIDYDHCKGCMICLAQCPPHAIEAVSESNGHKQKPKGV